MVAQIGWGLTFGIWNGSTYSDVAEVTGCKPPAYARDAVETTHMTSTSKYRTYIPGLLDAGEATLSLNYDASASDPLITAMEAATLGQFRITFGDANAVVFTAVVTSYEISEVTPDGKQTASATFKVSGRPTWS